MTWERLHPSGAWQVTDYDSEGYLIVQTFYGYNKREAQAEYREWKRTCA